MALRYGYFDSEIIGVDEEDMPIFDRAETSDLFALLFASLVSDGVLARPASCFQVLATGGMAVEVQPGFGMVRGRFACSDERMPLEVAPAPKKYSRIDRVVLRCNYLDRLCEIVIKTGTEAASPAPPALVRPSAGDYYELCLANIRLNAGQKGITQSSIADTRPNSAVCGYITQLIDHIDTSVFFAQFEQFYKEFVDKSEASYDEFRKMAQEAYRDFSADITAYLDALKKDSTDAYTNLVTLMDSFYRDLTTQGNDLYDGFRRDILGYIADLKTKGDMDLADITQQMLDFRDTNEADFLAWFDRIKGILGTNADGNLLNELDGIAGQLGDVEEMVFTGTAAARVTASDGSHITDNTGTPLLAGWPICQCGNFEKEA